ncbi:hypothetical protein [Brasilonema sp. UFV-L1]|uniref:hypothetical protein n=1 Tax=Brasilonema sp. UFV-L1 TaxID=2234130 RepID=UPI0030DDA4FE
MPQRAKRRNLKNQKAYDTSFLIFEWYFYFRHAIAYSTVISYQLLVSQYWSLPFMSYA